ncbi:MAG: PDZ domain-containing protein [Bacilli bacterium]|nr:PDZ domain-containing protein [Bacilli bacterium]
MFKKIKDNILLTIKEEYKFIIFMILLLIVLNYPLNYYIVMGGGISDASSRIEVESKKESKGSFNISYVSQLDANVLFYGLSYIVPTWEREDANLYKYTEEENLEDIQFRSDLDLETANGTATYWAYTLAKKPIQETSSKLYVIITYPDEYETELKVGDEIKTIDGNTYHTISEYSNYIQTKEVGESVEIVIERKKKEKTISSPVYELKNKKILGIGLQYVKTYETDPAVKIQFNKKESGPSGGLITTLEIYNQLTKKDLTNGYTIAGTGTIEEDGSIGQIGGIEHKVLGAASAKADIFLCPGGDNYQDAKKYIQEKNLKIKLIKVETIQDAIQKLEGLE